MLNKVFRKADIEAKTVVLLKEIEDVFPLVELSRQPLIGRRHNEKVKINAAKIKISRVERQVFDAAQIIRFLFLYYLKNELKKLTSRRGITCDMTEYRKNVLENMIGLYEKDIAKTEKKTSGDSGQI